MSEFLNVSNLDFSRVNGSQVKLTIDKKENNFFVGNATTRNKKDQLILALKERNRLFEKHNIAPNRILLNTLKLSVYSEKSNTEFNGICLTTSKGMDVIGACIRDLDTGLVTNRKVYLSSFSSFDLAVDEAIYIRDGNIRAYNKRVKAYNRVMFLKMLALAKTEVSTLRPQLQKLLGFDRGTWAYAGANL